MQDPEHDISLSPRQTSMQTSQIQISMKINKIIVRAMTALMAFADKTARVAVTSYLCSEYSLTW